MHYLNDQLVKYIDILDIEWNKCLNLATYAFNISPCFSIWLPKFTCVVL